MSAFNAHLDQDFVNFALDGEVLAVANRLTFRDPKHFVAGGLHCHPQVWSQLLASVPTFPQAAEVLKWIHQKVDVFDFFVPFKGPYKGEQFNSVLPPPKIFVNRLWCKPFTGFISQTILDRLCSGAISLLCSRAFYSLYQGTNLFLLQCLLMFVVYLHGKTRIARLRFIKFIALFVARKALLTVIVHPGCLITL